MFGHPKIQFLMDHGRFEEAEAAIREALADDFDDVWLYYLLANTYLAREKPRAAEAAAREAIQREPEFDPGHYVLARALLDRRHLKQAQEAIDDALRLDPEDADYFAIKSRILGEPRKYKKALEVAESGLALDPDNESCRFYRGVLLAKLGRHEEASAETLGLLSDDPEAAENHCARGWSLIQAGRGRDAQERFSEALRLEPDSDDARTGLVEAMKMSNPFVGLFLRALIRLDRIPIVYFLVGVYVLSSIAARLKHSDLPEPIPFLGNLCHIVFLFFFLVSLAVDPLFNLVLRFSKTGKYALTNSQSKAIKWYVVPVLLATVIVVYWLLNGGGSVPYAAFAWCAAAKIIYELFETENLRVRLAMGVLVFLAVGTAIWIEYASVTIIRPQFVEIQKAAQDMADGTVNLKEADPERFVEFAENFKSVMKQRDWLIRYPALALWIIAAFSDTIRNRFTAWFARD